MTGDRVAIEHAMRQLDTILHANVPNGLHRKALDCKSRLIDALQLVMTCGLSFDERCELATLLFDVAELLDSVP